MSNYLGDIGVAFVNWSETGFRVVWTSDGSVSGVVRTLINQCFHYRLVSFNAFHTGGLSGNYNVRLLDRYGADRLDGLCETLDADATNSGTLVKTLGTAGRRDLLLCGRHQLEITGATATGNGVFEVKFSDYEKGS